MKYVLPQASGTIPRRRIYTQYLCNALRTEQPKVKLTTGSRHEDLIPVFDYTGLNQSDPIHGIDHPIRYILIRTIIKGVPGCSFEYIPCVTFHSLKTHACRHSFLRRDENAHLIQFFDKERGDKRFM